MINNFFNKNFIYVFIILFLLLIVTTVPVQTSGGIRIEPSRFLIEMTPGSRTTEIITVTNNSDRKLNLMANFYDWDLNEQYELITHESGSLKETLDGILRFNPRSFSLEPGEQQMVRFTITFPDEEDPLERRGIIFFEHEDKFDEEDIGASVTSMVGTTVYASPLGTSFTFNLLDSLVLLSSEGDYQGAILTNNNSKKHVRFNIEYRVIDSKGRSLFAETSEERVVLPGENRGFLFPLQEDFTPGKYELLLNFEFTGAKETLTESIPFEIKP